MTNHKRLIALLLVFSMLSALQAKDIRQVVLHMDVNNTLIASDQIENKSKQNVINHFLSKKYYARWDASLEQPISYYQYVHEVLVPGSLLDQQLKKERKRFLDNFVETLKTQNHPLQQEVTNEFALANAKLIEANGNVFQSFYRLLEFLDANQIKYSIILRSYGGEVGTIAQEINRKLGHSLFPDALQFKQGALLTPRGLMEDPKNIYAYLTDEGSQAIRDDWLWWHEHHETGPYGKPFYVDPDDDVLQVFFDDHIHAIVDEHGENIIAAKDANTGAALDLNLLIASKQAVHVDTLEAIMQDDYFIEHVKEVLRINSN